MIRNLFFVSIIALAFSCSNGKTNNEEVIKVDDFLAKQAELVEKTVKVEGTVTHICMHGGKKLFIMGQDPEKTIKVTAGAGISQFDKTLEGTDVIIEGIVKETKVDEAYIVKLEAEAAANVDTTQKDTTKQEIAEHKNHLHEGESHATDNSQFDDLRKQIKESGKDYISFYAIECTKVEAKKEESTEKK